MYLVHTCSIYTVMKLMNITLWTYNQDCQNNIYISLPPGGLDTNTHKLKELSRWPTLHPRGGSRGRRHGDLYKAGNWITSIYGITDSRQDQGRYSGGGYTPPDPRLWHRRLAVVVVQDQPLNVTQFFVQVLKSFLLLHVFVIIFLIFVFLSYLIFQIL